MKLQTAVLVVVNEFSKSNTNFSAWEVTREIRECVNRGDYYIDKEDGCSGSYVPHNPVRDFIHELYDAGILSLFGVIDREDNGTYKTYIFEKDSQSEPVEDNDLVDAPVNPGLHTDHVDNVVVPTVVNSVLDPSVGDKVRNYVNNVVFPPTMKEIQSAVKVNGVTCQDIYDWLLSEKYEVEFDGPVSTRTVFLE